MDEIIEFAIAKDISVLKKILPDLKWISTQDACKIFSTRPCIMKKISEEYIAVFNATFFKIRMFFYATADILDEA
jgi:hypothetical protein